MVCRLIMPVVAVLVAVVMVTGFGVYNLLHLAQSAPKDGPQKSATVSLQHALLAWVERGSSHASFCLSRNKS